MQIFFIREPSRKPRATSVNPTRHIESFYSSRAADEMPGIRHRRSASAHKDVVGARDRAQMPTHSGLEMISDKVVRCFLLSHSHGDFEES